MKEHILEIIKQIEIDYEIKVLYACESGSRAWGLSSIHSDYDVRFLYVYKKNWYLSIDQKRDVLEIPKFDSISIPINDLLDISGWELTKALKLLRKSNPPLLEWLNSSIVYYEAYSTIKKMRILETSIFAPNSCMYHYLNMAKRNFREYLQEPRVKLKKYFTVIRPVLAAKWIEKHHSIPPVEFQKLVEELIPEGELKKSLTKLINRKIAGEELNLEPRIDEINLFLEKEIVHLEEYAKSIFINIPDPTEKLNLLFQETLEEVWKI